MIEFELQNGVLIVERKHIAAFVCTGVTTIILSTGDKFVTSYLREEVLEIMKGSKVPRRGSIEVKNILIDEIQKKADIQKEEINEEVKNETEVDKISYDNMITVESLAKCLGVSTKKVEKLIANENITLSQLSYNDVLRLLKENRLNKVKTVKSKTENGIRTNYLVAWPYTVEYTRKLADVAYEPLYQTVRDKYQFKCDQCECSEKLNIHHIDFNHANMDVNNLRLLCWECHNKIHRKSGHKRVDRNESGKFQSKTNWRKP